MSGLYSHVFFVSYREGAVVSTIASARIIFAYALTIFVASKFGVRAWSLMRRGHNTLLLNRSKLNEKRSEGMKNAEILTHWQVKSVPSDRRCLRCQRWCSRNTERRFIGCRMLDLTLEYTLSAMVIWVSFFSSISRKFTNGRIVEPYMSFY